MWASRLIRKRDVEDYPLGDAHRADLAQNLLTRMSVVGGPCGA
jgi:hypothetical protein